MMVSRTSEGYFFFNISLFQITLQFINLYFYFFEFLSIDITAINQNPRRLISDECTVPKGKGIENPFIFI